MTIEYRDDRDDPHRVAARRARSAAEALAQAETASPEERTYFRAAAALQALAAYFAEASEDDPGLKAALEESVSAGESAVAMRERMPEEYLISPPEHLPASQRALTLAFHALKTEAARRQVDLSGVVRATITGA